MKLVDFDQPLTIAFEKCWEELRRATVDKRHPFRFMVLATDDKDIIGLRWVVLRAIEEETLWFYTDNRTRKIEGLSRQNQASLLFYHPNKKLQIKFVVDASIHHQDEQALRHWQNVQGKAQKAYSPIIVPGTPIEAPEDAHQWPSEFHDEHFCAIACEPLTADVLQLNRLDHLRFEGKKDQGSWSLRWIAP